MFDLNSAHSLLSIFQVDYLNTISIRDYENIKIAINNAINVNPADKLLQDFSINYEFVNENTVKNYIKSNADLNREKIDVNKNTENNSAPFVNLTDYVNQKINTNKNDINNYYSNYLKHKNINKLYLNLSHNTFSPNEKFFSNCDSLEELKISLGYQDISGFNNCPNLKLVDLDIKNLTAKEFNNFLNNCPNIQIIKYSTYSGSVFQPLSHLFEKFKYVIYNMDENKFCFCMEQPENIPDYLYLDLDLLKNTIHDFNPYVCVSSMTLFKYFLDSQENFKYLNKNKIKIPLALCFIDAFDGFQNYNFKFIKKDLNELVSHTDDSYYQANTCIFLKMLGCFNNEKILKNEQDTGTVIAQKASGFIVDLYKNNRENYSKLIDSIVKEKTFIDNKNYFKNLKNNYKFLEFISNKLHKQSEYKNLNLLLDLEKENPGLIVKTILNFDKICEIKKLGIINEFGKNKALSWESAILQSYNSYTYYNVTEETRDAAALLNSVGFTQKNFDKYLKIVNTQKEKNIKHHILDKELNEIELIKQQTLQVAQNSKKNLKQVFEKNFTYEFLDKYDPKNAILGIYASCCASLASSYYGATIAEQSMTEDNVQNIVIKEKSGDIIAKGAMYVNKQKGYAVINDFELNEKYKKGEIWGKSGYYKFKNKDRKQIYEAFIRGVNKFVEEYNLQNPNKNITQVNIGMGCNRLRSYCAKLPKQLFGLEAPDSFADAQASQRILYRNKKSLKQKIKEKLGIK